MSGPALILVYVKHGGAVKLPFVSSPAAALKKYPDEFYKLLEEMIEVARDAKLGAKGKRVKVLGTDWEQEQMFALWEV